MRTPALVAYAVWITGCGPASWERFPPPDIHSPTALLSLERFVATNGWDMHTNGGSILWEYEEHPKYITDLPWASINTNQFQALTREGILYVLIDVVGHHDYTGVAYNPRTNRFPKCIRGFKPLGNHWYVWFQPEFWASGWTDGRYE